MSRLYICFMLVGFFALNLTSLSAVELDPDFEIVITLIESQCDEFAVSFRFNNIPAPPPQGQVDVVDMDLILLRSDGSVLATADGILSLHITANYRTTIPLTPPTSGGSYRMILRINDDFSEERWFDIDSCDDNEATASEQSVELPPCEIEDTRLDEGCGSTFVVTYAQV